MTLLDRVEPGKDSYVHTFPPQRPAGVARSWSYAGYLRSWQWRAGGIVKSRRNFAAHRKDDDFLALLDEARTRGVKRPSSYASLLHDSFLTPRPSRQASRAMAWPTAGGWEALLVKPGTYLGTFYKYDMTSAYLWAAMDGLPHPKSYRLADRISRQYDGVYLIRCEPNDTAPYPYTLGGTLLATRDEIELYGLRGPVLWGAVWTRVYDTDPMVRAITDWSCWKNVGRMYWGRWASGLPVDCAIYDRSDNVSSVSQLPPMPHAIWAHIILSRVRRRLYDVTRYARVLRVYVDDIITDTPLTTGESIGQWHLKRTFNGVTIRNLHVINDAV